MQFFKQLESHETLPYVPYNGRKRCKTSHRSPLPSVNTWEMFRASCLAMHCETSVSAPIAGYPRGVGKGLTGSHPLSHQIKAKNFVRLARLQSQPTQEIAVQHVPFYNTINQLLSKKRLATENICVKINVESGNFAT